MQGSWIISAERKGVNGNKSYSTIKWKRKKGNSNQYSADHDISMKSILKHVAQYDAKGRETDAYFNLPQFIKIKKHEALITYKLGY